MQAVTLQVGLNTRIVPISKQDLGLKLIEALSRSDNIKANELIDAGADLSVTTKFGQDVLSLACRLPTSELAIKLIDLGCNVNPPSNGSSPLLISCYKGDSELAIKLIDAGANVDACYNDGITPLMFAVYKDMPELAEKLIAKGANLNAEYVMQQYYLTPFQNNRDIRINTAVLLAIKEKKEDIAIMLIDAGAELDAYFAFLIACKNGVNKVAIKLIDNGVDVNPHDEENIPLFLALNNCSFEVCLKIITSDSLVYLPIYRLGDTFGLLTPPTGLYERQLLYTGGLEMKSSSLKPDNINDMRLQKALSFNFPKYPVRYQFTLNDYYLLNSKNRKIVDTLTVTRALTQSNLALMPNELLQTLLANIFS